MPHRILVVDDDKQIIRLVQSYLEKAGMSVLAAYDGEQAQQVIRRERPDLIVLDLMLPKRDGWEITRWLRGDAHLASIPILMLTARVEDSDKILGLELGADDYLTKPFNPAEVAARVRAILRRAQDAPLAPRVLQIRGLRLDTDEHRVALDNRDLETTPTEFALLKALLENPNHAFTRAELIERALGYGYEGLERTLDSHIKNLRKKIGEDFIETVFGVGYLVASAPIDALAPTEQTFLDELRQSLVVAALLAGALGIALGLGVSRALAAPLAGLAEAARAFAARDWSRRVTPRGADEIAAVAREFNAMASALQSAETQRQNLTADIAHELRTPLTVLQGNLRAMLDDVYPLARAEIATLYDETRLLARLVDDLRELALADAGQLVLDLQAVELRAVLQSAAQSLSAAADAQKVELWLEPVDASLHVHADADRLAQVLRNLISNALRHTPAGGVIRIQCSVVSGQRSTVSGQAPALSEREGSAVRISVTDTGEGIAAEDLSRVFDRFYRADKSRGRALGGSGLGLAIAKSLVAAMGGEIGVESELGKGSVFLFTVRLA